MTLSGQHAARHHVPRRHPNLLPAIAGVLVAAVLIGGAVAALQLGPAGGVDVSGVAADRSAPARADRGEPRTEPSASTLAEGMSAPSPTSSPSPRKSTSPTPRKSMPAPSGSVVSSGTCGVSYYSTGSTTASGEPFDPNGLTAAHKTLPFDTKVRVTNPANGKSVVVRINDRGPFVSGRCLDLARGAFMVISSLGAGVISNARYEVLK
jgi:rare lipoprotein A